MKKDDLIYINHIQDCITQIKSYTQNLTKNDFLSNRLIQDAVIRNFEIIGEATKNLNIEFRVKYSAVEWKKIAGLRDKLIHDYIGVDMWAVWGVVESILPEFEKQIAEILNFEQGGI
jgi:hypothetical protein